jgi:hypothetical protein
MLISPEFVTLNCPFFLWLTKAVQISNTGNGMRDLIALHSRKNITYIYADAVRWAITKPVTQRYFFGKFRTLILCV